MILYYYEKCDSNFMFKYQFFFLKLQQLQNICEINSEKKYELGRIFKIKNNDIHIYQLGNIIWDDTLLDNIKNHNKYPSEYFVNIIITTQIDNDEIINPPMELYNNDINKYRCVFLDHNKLAILDALFYQGSAPNYIVIDSSYNRMIHSEHSGAITLCDDKISDIIISTKTNRIDVNDKNIYLPNDPNLSKKEIIIFHTHPNNMMTYANRINNDGVLYEFPSINDILNFKKNNEHGKTQASIIIAPEGLYVVRKIKIWENINIGNNIYKKIYDFIIKLENMAITKFNKHGNKLKNPDFFHSNVSADRSFINIYNEYMKKYNIFIEYYPRQKKEYQNYTNWFLPEIYIRYVSYNH